MHDVWQRQEMHTKFLSENLKRRNHSEDLGVDRIWLFKEKPFLQPSNRSFCQVTSDNISKTYLNMTTNALLFKTNIIKLIVIQVVKKFSAFYGTQRLIPCSQGPATGPYWARWNQPTSSHPISPRSTLILSSFPFTFSIYEIYAFLTFS